MDSGKLAVFRMAMMTMDHSAQRQKVIAQNVANADTPNYAPSDIARLSFRDMAAGIDNRVHMVTTNPGHSNGTRPAPDTYRNREDRTPFESSPNGNGVVLEEQMDKLRSTRSSYTLAAEIYRKHLNMLKMAARGTTGGR